MKEALEIRENRPVPAVLFVDDEQNILSSLRRLMMASEDEVDVFTADSGARGLEILRDNRDIGLIVSDQRMPGMNGAEFLRQAREVSPDAIRFILTGYADIGATIDAINHGGAHRHVSKPWNDEELLEAIRESLSFYSLSRENERLAAIVKEQNEELREWNARLKTRVLQQTANIREKNEELDRRNARLKANFRGTIDAFSSLLDMMAQDLRNHSRNVATLAVGLAQALGTTAGETEVIRVAARLHDIGKIGIPERLLGISEEEMLPQDREEFMRHAIRGQAAIDAIADLRPAGV